MLLLLSGVIGGVAPSASAAPVLTVQPITWNVIGLDSNDVNSGPNRFMVGARACNTGTDPATNVTATFVWDSTNAFINLVGGSSVSTATLAPGACFDFYFNVVVTRTTSAYDTTRKYHIAVTADGLGTVTTPIGREIYVEKLVSQNRNSVQAITGPGGLGDPAPTTVFVGQTYTYKLYSSTATGGYEQLENFINFTNTIFQVLSVSESYTQPPGATNNKIYADACGWDNNPLSPTYRSCIGPVNYAGGKAGGTIVSTFVVKVIAPGTTILSTLIYDFSGSSYHYNSDFGTGLNAILVRAVTPADLSLTKSHTGNFTVGSQGTYQLTATNDGGVSASGPITITDTLPTGMSFVSGTGSGWSCSAVGQDVTCTRATSLSAGASSSVTLTVSVGPAAAPQVTNSATVSFNGSDSTPADNTATDVTTVNPSADVSIDVSHSGELVVGLPFTFNIQVANNGPSPSSGPIQVTDTLPAGMTYLSFSGSGWDCSAVGQEVTCTYGGDLASGASSSFSLVVDVDESAFPSVTNSATVVPTTPDPDSSNNSDSDFVSAAGAADLSLDKSHTGNFVGGQQGTYDFAVANDGSGAATGPVIVSDTLPAGLSYASFSGSGWDCSAVGQDVTCTHATDLAAGGSSSFSITVDVASDAPASVTNEAVVSSDSPDADASNNLDDDATNIDRVSDLSLVKSHTGDFLVGTLGSYDLEVSNAGPSDAEGPITVSDTLPAGLSYVSFSGSGWDCSAVGQDVTCTRAADLAAGASDTVSITVDAAVAAAPSVTNTASVSSATPDPDDANNQSSDPTTVLVVDLSIAKSHTENFVAGEQGTYDVLVSNDGTGDATGPITVSDTLPAGLSYASFSGPGWDCSAVGQDVTCTHEGDLAAGATSSFSVMVDMASDAPASVTNEAVVSSDSPDADASNNTAQDPTDIARVSDLSIAKSHTGDFVVGTQGSYDIQVSNAGPSDAEGPIIVTDALPAGLSFVSFSGAGWSCSASGQDVTCTHAGDLAADGSSNFSITADVGLAAIPSVTNSAAVAGPTPDPDDTNNQTSDPTAVDQDADLSITKTAVSDTFFVGATRTFNLTVSNAGPSVATGVEVADTLPSGLSYVSATASQGSCGQIGGVVLCSLGSLAPGDSAEITLVVSVTEAGNVDNTAEVSSEANDPDPSNNSDTVNVTLVDPPPPQQADLSVVKSHNGPFVVGAQGTYDIAVSNGGPSDADGPITVSDTLPAGLTFASFSGSGWDCSASGQDVTCTHAGTLAADATSTVSVTVDVDETALPDVTNVASVQSPTADQDDTNNTAQDPTDVSADADLSVVKSHTGSFVVGTQGTYDITVSNAGPSDATGPVTVTDSLPTGLGYASFWGTGWDCSAIGQDVTCTHAADLASGSNATVSIVVNVGPAASPSVTNSASAASETIDSDLSNNSDSDPTTVDASADLSITKSASPDPVQVGDELTYTLSVTNAGPSPATGVETTDTLPAGVSFVSAAPEQGSCTGTAVVVCSLGTIASGETVNVEIVVTPTAAGEIDNTASVLSDVSDPDPSDNSDGAGATATPIPQADLSITKAHDGALHAGKRETYVLTVSNAGPQTASGPLVVTDELPDALTFVSASGDGWTCVSAANIVTCQHVDDLAADATSSVELVVRVDAGASGEVSNSGSVVSRTADPDGANNSDSDSALVPQTSNDDDDDDPSTPDESSTTTRRPTLAFTGFDFARLGWVAFAFLVLGIGLVGFAALIRRRPRRRENRRDGASSTESMDAWSGAPQEVNTLGLTPKRASRLGIASLIVSALVVGHVGWMVWGSGLGTARAQAQLRTEFGQSAGVDRHSTGRTYPVGSPIGVIRIPRIHLDMVVVEGTASEQLQKGPGHYRNTAMPWDESGRVGIAGHRTTYLHPFLALNQLRVGDRITIATRMGTFEYEVRELRVVDPHDMSVLDQTRRPTLALTTCDPIFSAAKRLIVLADRLPRPSAH
ncbi:MAG TPA: sortase [Actinomycetota bacterium]